MTDAAPRHARWKLYLPVGIAVALLLGYTLLWFQGARIMRAEIDAWVAREAADGRIAQHGDIRMAGYPGAVRAVIDAPVWLDPDQGRAWRAETLLVIAQPVSPRTLILAPRGAQEVVWGERTYDLEAEDLRVSLQPEQVALQGENVTARSARDEAGLTLGEVRATWIDGEGGEVMGVEARGVVFGDASSADGTPTLPLLRAALSGNGTAGAPLTLDGFEIAVTPPEDERPSLVKGQGPVQLDAGGRPVGTLTVTFTDAASVLAMLGEQGLLPPEQAQLAASVAPMLANEAGEVVLPLRFADGEVTAAGMLTVPMPRFGG